MRRVLGGFLLVLALGGCTNPRHEDLWLAYGKAVREVGLFPVYPPREEFQIGDVYMWSQAVADPNDTVSVYLTTIDWLRGAADSFMGSRIVFENANRSGNAKPSVETDIPKSPGSSSKLVLRRETDDLSRSLPIAAFPSITADAGFTAGLGVVNVLYALGLGGGSRTTVTLNFDDVRTYWVPTAQVMGQILADIPTTVVPYIPAGRIDRNRRVALRRGAGTPACGNGRQCGISVVTRVYLTRKIDYTYRNARIVAAALRRAEAGADLSKVPAAPSVTVSVKANAEGAIDDSVLTQQVESLKNQVDAMANSNTPGQSLRFAAWDARGVTFSSEYLRPVVVGWDGIDLNFRD